MGSIIDQNSNAAAEDNWALVYQGIVVNTIVGDLSDVTNIQNNYDFLIDLNVQGQTDVSIGWLYDSGSDSFTNQSPPVDHGADVRNDFNNIVAALIQCVDDVGYLDQKELATAFGYSMNDNSGNIDDATISIMEKIYSYIVEEN